MTVEDCLKELREMFPLIHEASWYNFEIRTAVYVRHDRDRYEIIRLHIDGVGREWREHTWSGSTVDDCMAQVRAWKESHER